ncbi:MAG: FkbM family methyltransferase [bacterium]
MDQNQKDALKSKILKRYELYKLQSSRLKRLLKDPIRTLPYYIMQFWAYRKPFKISYKTLWGDKMSFYLPEGNAIYYYGFFEANLTNFFLNFLKEGDIFIDIGAHVGYYTMLANKLVGETGQVHSFEPTPRTFNTLKENVKDKINVFVNNYAVMDKKTKIEFLDYGPKYSAFNSYKKRIGEDAKFLPIPKKVIAETISLDDYCNNKNINPTLIKIDAEGAEHLILKAMENILTNIKPIITIEVAGDEEWKDNCHKSIQILENHNYIVYEISTDGYLKLHTEKETYSYDNLVFIHTEKISLLKDLIK